MRVWCALVAASPLWGQEEQPAPKRPQGPTSQNHKLRAALPTPQAVLRALVAQNQARRIQPGATVEVIGYDEEAALS